MMAIGYTFLAWPEDSLMTYNSFGIANICGVVIAVFLIIRWRHLNKSFYWEKVKGNVIRVVIGFFICGVLFLSLDMSEDFKNLPQ